LKHRYMWWKVKLQADIVAEVGQAQMRNNQALFPMVDLLPLTLP
jgi:hypothetical protein